MTVQRHSDRTPAPFVERSSIFLLEVHLPEWYERAVCAQTDPEAFFPEKGGSTRNAKAICRESCEVRERCLEWAIDNDERFGIWGGHSERERRKIVKERMLAARAAVTESAAS